MSWLSLPVLGNAALTVAKHVSTRFMEVIVDGTYAPEEGTIAHQAMTDIVTCSAADVAATLIGVAGA